MLFDLSPAPTRLSRCGEFWFGFTVQRKTGNQSSNFNTMRDLSATERGEAGAKAAKEGGGSVGLGAERVAAGGQLTSQCLHRSGDHRKRAFRC